LPRRHPRVWPFAGEGEDRRDAARGEGGATAAGEAGGAAANRYA